ncbi:hypothetical protein [Halothiobacillus sp. DCM-1]|uniref:hypothetical protein n=1 Tax=Halothiobacillus sp. DCM-1 TaxID=3112558 RepID=UPI00324F802A
MRPTRLFTALAFLIPFSGALWAATPEDSQSPGLCANARFSKSLVLARVVLPAPPPDILHLGAALAERIATHLRSAGDFQVRLTEPTVSTHLEPAVDAFARWGIPYFVRLSGKDFGVSGQTSVFSMIGPSINPRGGTLHLVVSAGMTAEPVLNTTLHANPVAGALFNPPIDALGTGFWQTPYGQSLDALSQQAASAIADQLRCTPLIGTVLAVDGSTVTINRGSADGLRFSDAAMILARSDPLNGLGQPILPERFTFHRSAEARIRQLDPHTAKVQIQGDGTVQVGDIVWVGQ